MARRTARASERAPSHRRRGRLLARTRPERRSRRVARHSRALVGIGRRVHHRRGRLSRSAGVQHRVNAHPFRAAPHHRAARRRAAPARPGCSRPRGGLRTRRRTHGGNRISRAPSDVDLRRNVGSTRPARPALSSQGTHRTRGGVTERGDRSRRRRRSRRRPHVGAAGRDRRRAQRSTNRTRLARPVGPFHSCMAVAVARRCERRPCRIVA